VGWKLQMRRSKLEIYTDILAVLKVKGPLKLTHIMYKSNVNCSVLKEQLEFLIKNNLVEERVLKKERIVYAISPRGVAILRAFSELRKVFPTEEKEAPIIY
jgi:predicted transcriptional regulator